MPKDKLLLKDYLSSRIIAQNKMLNNYGKIYYQTNEDLFSPFLEIDFRNKNVLSVLSSGDHVLTARCLGAHIVDAFDNNRLTLYYFYLRLWSIKYRKVLYPQILNDNEWLESLLKLVEPQNNLEQKALIFFKKHLEMKTHLENLFYDINAQPKGSTIYTKAEELKYSINPHLNFYHADLFSEFDIPMKYDIILISNILDWAKNDPHKLATACQNLTKVTDDNGLILCSSLNRLDNESFEKEKEIFEKKFIFTGDIADYTYTRKRAIKNVR